MTGFELLMIGSEGLNLCQKVLEVLLIEAMSHGQGYEDKQTHGHVLQHVAARVGQSLGCLTSYNMQVKNSSYLYLDMATGMVSTSTIYSYLSGFFVDIILMLNLTLFIGLIIPHTAGCW